MNCSAIRMPPRHPSTLPDHCGASPQPTPSRRGTEPNGHLLARCLLWLLAALLAAPAALAADRSLPVNTLEEAVASGRVPATVLEQLGRNGIAHVMVRVVLPAAWAPEPTLSGVAVEQQRQAIAAAQLAVIDEIAGLVPKPPRRLRATPYLSVWVDTKALTQLVRSPHVHRVLENARRQPLLARSGVAGGVTPVQNGLGLLGSGQTIAVIDSGVDRAHRFFGGRVVSEACFSEDGGLFSSVEGVCPNGADSAIGPGAAAPCAHAGCAHGTQVAGIAAGAPFTGTTLSGVASNANLLAIQAVHLETDADDCGGAPAPCILLSDSDVLYALERVYDLRNAFSIAAVNMSLGGGRFTDRAACDDASAYTEAVANLVAADIAVVAASGNDAAVFDGNGNVTGFRAGIAAPACNTGVIAVGSLDSAGVIAPTSQFGSLLTMLAVGRSVTSSVPGGGFRIGGGTSFAAPQVAGAIAALAGLDPTLSSAALRARILATGAPTSDARSAPALVRPRLQLDLAVEQQEGRPLPPSGVRVLATAGRSLQLGWVDNARSETAHRLQARLPGGAAPVSAATVPGAGVIAGTIGGLVPNTEYELTVEACDAAARCSLPSMRLRARTANTIPAAPINVRAVVVSPTSIDLLWENASTVPVTGFRIGHPAVGPSPTHTVAASVRRQPFMNLQPGRRYEFWIEALNGGEHSARVTVSAATPVAGPPPAAPVNLRVCTSNLLVNECFANVTRLLWNDVAVDETRYEFEQTVLPPGTPVGAATFQPTTLPANSRVRDLSLVTGVRYAFRVRACNTFGCSAYSNTLVYTKP